MSHSPSEPVPSKEPLDEWAERATTDQVLHRLRTWPMGEIGLQAADEIVRARRTAEHWKTEHLAGNTEIERLTEALRQLEDQLRRALDVDRATHEPRVCPHCEKCAHGCYRGAKQCLCDATVGQTCCFFGGSAQPPGDVG